MYVLCAIGLRGGASLVARVLSLTGGHAVELLLLYVRDPRPRRELERLASPLRRGPVGGPERERALRTAEEAAAQAALNEALQVAKQAGVPASTRLADGPAERVIVEIAREVQADVIAIRAREIPGDHPVHGPGSVGHTARFVLDHAPCDVLLVRTATAE